MIRLYRGQICLGIAVAFAILAGVAAWQYAVTDRGDVGSMVWFGLACTGAVGTLVSVSFAYTEWVPKWERDEKRTGKFPGEKEKK